MLLDGGEQGDYSVKSCHIYTKPDSNESFKSNKEEMINLTNLKNQSLSIEILNETGKNLLLLPSSTLCSA